jgi:hypothetical protein
MRTDAAAVNFSEIIFQPSQTKIQAPVPSTLFIFPLRINVENGKSFRTDADGGGALLQRAFAR